MFCQLWLVSTWPKHDCMCQVLAHHVTCLLVVPQTVLALRGSDGFSRDLWRRAGVNPRSLDARSCCKNRYLVTLTFAPLERNRGSRAQTQKNSMVFVTFVLGRAMIARQPQTPQMSAVETGQMSSVETGQMSAVETGQMSAVETRQMSSAETRQMSTSKTGRGPVSLFYICLVSAEDICLASTADICPVSLSQQQTSVLFPQQTSLLLHESTSVL